MRDDRGVFVSGVVWFRLIDVKPAFFAVFFRNVCAQWYRRVFLRLALTAVVLVFSHSLSIVNATLAQLVEQLICNQQVVGSSPTSGSIENLVALVHRGFFIFAMV